MSIIIQKETTTPTTYSQFIDEQYDSKEIISFLEQIRSFKLPETSSGKVSSISVHSLRFENNPRL